MEYSKNKGKIDIVTLNAPFITTPKCNHKRGLMYPTPDDYVNPVLNALGNRPLTYGPLAQNLYGYISEYMGRVAPDARWMYNLIGKFIKTKSALYPSNY